MAWQLEWVHAITQHCCNLLTDNLLYNAKDWCHSKRAARQAACKSKSCCKSPGCARSLMSVLPAGMLDFFFFFFSNLILDAGVPAPLCPRSLRGGVGESDCRAEGERNPMSDRLCSGESIIKCGERGFGEVNIDCGAALWLLSQGGCTTSSAAQQDQVEIEVDSSPYMTNMSRERVRAKSLSL